MKAKELPAEGQVYRCSWKKRGKLYELKCLQPQVETTHADLDRAQEDLCAKIMDVTGDGETLLQFAPALPEVKSMQSRFLPEYYHVEYNDAVEWDTGNVRELYSEGVCKRCGIGLGLRTKISRVVTSMPRYDVVGFRKDRNIRAMFSDALLKYICPFLPKNAELVEVRFEQKIQKRLAGKVFYELDFTPVLKAMVPRNHDGFSKLSSFRCPTCKSQHLFFLATKIRKKLSTFVLRSQAQGRVLLLGEGFCRVMAIDARLHKTILGDKKIKGLVTDRLVMLDEDEALSVEELQKVKLPAP